MGIHIAHQSLPAKRKASQIHDLLQTALISNTHFFSYLHWDMQHASFSIINQLNGWKTVCFNICIVVKYMQEKIIKHILLCRTIASLHSEMYPLSKTYCTLKLPVEIFNFLKSQLSNKNVPHSGTQSNCLSMQFCEIEQRWLSI